MPCPFPPERLGLGKYKFRALALLFTSEDGIWLMHHCLHELSASSQLAVYTAHILVN